MKKIIIPILIVIIVGLCGFIYMQQKEHYRKIENTKADYDWAVYTEMTNEFEEILKKRYSSYGIRSNWWSKFIEDVCKSSVSRYEDDLGMLNAKFYTDGETICYIRETTVKIYMILVYENRVDNNWKLESFTKDTFSHGGDKKFLRDYNTKMLSYMQEKGYIDSFKTN